MLRRGQRLHPGQEKYRHRSPCRRPARRLRLPVLHSLRGGMPQRYEINREVSDVTALRKDYPAILRRYFLPDELKRLDRTPSGERLYTLRTRLEGILKAEGTGFEHWRQRRHSLLRNI